MPAEEAVAQVPPDLVDLEAVAQDRQVQQQMLESLTLVAEVAGSLLVQVMVEQVDLALLYFLIHLVIISILAQGSMRKQ
jgi:hypothetical protein